MEIRLDGADADVRRVLAAPRRQHAVAVQTEGELLSGGGRSAYVVDGGGTI